MFSIVLPVYNGAHIVKDAIDAVLAQTYADWELIIVNDGSTDNTGEVLSAHAADPRIRIITQKNGGVSVARNRGMAEAKYPYIAFIDADDLWKENHLSTLSEMIAAHPDGGMYCTFAETLFADGSLQSDCPYFDGKPEILYLNDFHAAYADDKRAKMYAHASSCIAAEAITRLGGFTVGCKIGEDLELALRIAAYYPVVLCGRPTAIYRKAYSTATKDVSFDPDWHFFDAVEAIYADPTVDPGRKANLRRVMAWFTIRRCRHYLIDGRRRDAAATYRSIGKTELKKDKALTAILMCLPCALTKKIFLWRWQSLA